MKNNFSDKTLGIYVHIPFCVQKCKYCDFCSFASLGEELKTEYKNAIVTDISRSAEHFKDHIVDSIFFGGGTPTCLSAEQLSEILKAVFGNYNVSNEAEITLECNPATADKNYFDKLIKAFSPDELGFTLDTYWVQVGGADTCDWLKKLKGRVECIHLKDLAIVNDEQHSPSSET